MRSKALILLLVLLSASVSAQNNVVDIEAAMSRSKSLEISHPGLKYSYNNTTQTHDYSGNWDFDGDGYYDSLFFIGTGGAHLFFYLRIVLSCDKLVRNYSWLELDMPWLDSVGALEKAAFYPPPLFPMFVVHNFDNDIQYEIYLHLSDPSSEVSEEWKKRGVNSEYLILNYEKGEIVIRNFVP